MAKLIKKQLGGKIVKKIITAATGKAEEGVVGKVSKDAWKKAKGYPENLLKGSESMINVNTGKALKNPRYMTPAEKYAKAIEDSYRKSGGSIKSKKK